MLVTALKLKLENQQTGTKVSQYLQKLSADIGIDSRTKMKTYRVKITDLGHLSTQQLKLDVKIHHFKPT